MHPSPILESAITELGPTTQSSPTSVFPRIIVVRMYDGVSPQLNVGVDERRGGIYDGNTVKHPMAANPLSEDGFGLC